MGYYFTFLALLPQLLPKKVELWVVVGLMDYWLLVIFFVPTVLIIASVRDFVMILGLHTWLIPCIKT